MAKKTTAAVTQKQVKKRPGSKSLMLRIRITPEQQKLFADAAEIEALELGTWLRQVGVKSARALLGKE